MVKRTIFFQIHPKYLVFYCHSKLFYSAISDTSNFTNEFRVLQKSFTFELSLLKRSGSTERYINLMPQVTKGRLTSMNFRYAFNNVFYEKEKKLSFREIKSSNQLSSVRYFSFPSRLLHIYL